MRQEGWRVFSARCNARMRSKSWSAGKWDKFLIVATSALTAFTKQHCYVSARPDELTAKRTRSDSLPA